MNNITIVGRLAQDVELRYVAGTGTPVANITVAVDRDFVAKDGKKQADFLDVQIWNKQAETCNEWLSKGDMVSVSGSVRVDSYEDNLGNKRRSWKINANRVQFLNTKKSKEQNKNSNNSTDNGFTPNFTPEGLDPSGFQAIDDDDMPF